MLLLLTGLASQPFILLFLVVAAGYALGRLSYKGIGLGATASTLVVGLGISLLATPYRVAFNVPEFASTIFFNLFMFSVGMKVGPQFIAGLKRDAAKFIAVGVIIPALAVALMFVVRALFDLEPGMTAGIFAGANTATPGLGAAQAAYTSGVGKLPPGVSPPEAIANLSTAFAFGYCISMVGFIVLMKLGPRVLHRDVVKAARDFEASIQGESNAALPGSAEEFLVGPLPARVRTYSLEQPNVVGHRLGELRRTHPLVSVERILRGGHLLDPTDDVVLQAGDTLALYGPIPRLILAATIIGPEVHEAEVGNVGSQTVEVVVHNLRLDGHKLIDLARDAGHGLYMNGLFRGGDALPFGPETVIRKGDVLRVTGSNYRVKLLEKEVGTVIRPSVSTDIVTLAVALALGALVGMLTIPIGGMRITVGSAVGLLLVGIGLSTLRTRYPAFGGPYPEPARQFIEDLGLNVFVAILGLNAGAGVVKAIASGALTPILAGVLIVGMLPAIASWFVGSKLLKMNDALLLGSVAGGRSNSAGMRAAQEATRSNVPAISYPVTFALSNILMTIMTYVFAMTG